ncbi:restriction endonuclease subunit S [Piscibacillus sp. B03]|uniref:restriction endonuclease subunit S n=1 Tax=Piscibacillus sp. B03 TaxID=3457430 RepID=UPI003FCCC93A
MEELKKYTSFIDSEIEWLGEIPNSWNLIKLKYLCMIDTGSKDTQDKKENGKYPLFVRADTVEGIDEFTHDEEAVMTAGDGVGVGRVFHYYNGKFSAHQRVYVFTKFSNIVAKYLYYYLKSNLAFEVLRVNAKSTVDSLRRPMLAEFLIALPSIEEQRKIADFLDQKTSEIDDLIADKERLIELLEEKRQAVITEAVTKGLDPGVEVKDSGIEWLSSIPRWWTTTKIKAVSEVRNSNVDKKSSENETPVKLCNYVDVYYNNEITNELNFMSATAKPEQINTFSLKKDDVIITKDSESPDDIAVPAWVQRDLDGVVCGYHLSMLRPKKLEIEGKYLFYSLISNGIKDQFQISANGVTRFGLSIHAIKNAIVPLPPINEQREIINHIDKINSDIDIIMESTKVQINKLKEYRQSLIYEAVTGKIDVRDYPLERKEEAYVD